MASSCFPAPTPAGAALQLPSCWAPQPREWGRGDGPGFGGGGGSSSSSPAPSPDSCSGASPAWRAWPRAGPRSRAGSRPRRGPGQQRQSASQREKLRMRRLAQALHTLRRYLPASVAPAGQSLTKIETLRLAIRYIGHLSELLGIADQAPAARAGAARARPCCAGEPPGLACGPDSGPPSPHPHAWLQPLSSSPGATGPPTCCRRPPPSPGFPLSTPPGSEAAAWLCAAAATRCFDAPKPSEDERPAAQGLPTELLAFLEGFLPPPSHA